MMNEIATCGIAARAVVMFSNKNNVSRLYRLKLYKKIKKKDENFEILFKNLITNY